MGVPETKLEFDGWVLVWESCAHILPRNSSCQLLIFNKNSAYKKWSPVLGSESFIDWVKGKYYDLKLNEEVSQTKALSPEAVLVIQTVCDYYDVSRNDLFNWTIFSRPFKIKIYNTLYNHEILSIMGNHGSSNLTSQSGNSYVVIMFWMHGIEFAGVSKFMTGLSN